VPVRVKWPQAVGECVVSGSDTALHVRNVGVIGIGAAVRSTVEKHQPSLGLHGHIHESRGAIKIGNTLCVNPGSEYGEGILRGTIVNLEHRKIKGYLLTSG